MIGVVIPYFQREGGLLARALRSIADQEGGFDGKVVVVDDESPSPAHLELIDLDPHFVQRVDVIRQVNSGPAAARNVGIAALIGLVDTIAFLDSDDAWTPDHSGKVAAAIGAGAEFYFANFQREEDGSTRFSECGFQPDGGPASVGGGEIFWCSADHVFSSVVRASPIGTPTVALATSILGETRFLADLRTAGEDTLFWLDILSKEPRVACGVSPETRCGRGVSVFNHRSWGDLRALTTLGDQAAYQMRLLERYRLSTDLMQAGVDELSRIDERFVAALLACLARGRVGGLRPAFGYFARRPRALMAAPAVLWKALLRRPQS